MMMYQVAVTRRSFLKGGASGLAVAAIKHANGDGTASGKVAICWSSFAKFAQQPVPEDVGRFTFFVTADEANQFQVQLQQLQQAGHAMGFRPKSHNYQAEYTAWRASVASAHEPHVILGLKPTKKLAQFCAHLSLPLAVWQHGGTQLDLNRLATPQLLNAASYAQTVDMLEAQRLTSVTLASFRGVSRQAIEL